MYIILLLISYKIPHKHKSNLFHEISQTFTIVVDLHYILKNYSKILSLQCYDFRPKNKICNIYKAQNYLSIWNTYFLFFINNY